MAVMEHTVLPVVVEVEQVRLVLLVPPLQMSEVMVAPVQLPQLVALQLLMRVGVAAGAML